MMTTKKSKMLLILVLFGLIGCEAPYQVKSSPSVPKDFKRLTIHDDGCEISANTDSVIEVKLVAARPKHWVSNNVLYSSPKHREMLEEYADRFKLNKITLPIVKESELTKTVEFDVFYILPRSDETIKFSLVEGDKIWKVFEFKLKMTKQ